MIDPNLFVSGSIISTIKSLKKAKISSINVCIGITLYREIN